MIGFPLRRASSNILKTAIISTSNFGGAGTAAFRLHLGLSRIGCDSIMLVALRRGSLPSVIQPTNKRLKLLRQLGNYLDSLPTFFYSNRDRTAPFSLAWFPTAINALLRHNKSDLTNLHWINEGFCSVESIGAIRGPVVWTLHDMWAFTGGCHYSGECSGFERRCGKCPQLHSDHTLDVSMLTICRKERSWRTKKLSIVTPSQWLADCAGRSALLKSQKIRVIAPGIDLDRFRPLDTTVIRSFLGLEEDRLWLLFGAWGNEADPRKGFDLLRDALVHLAEDSRWKDRIGIITFGAGYTECQKDQPFPVRPLGELGDELSLILAYNAADLFVAPSRQDNTPNTIVEAMACGTPSVAFRVGGIPDLIDHRLTGYLAEPFSTEDLSSGIAWALSSVEQRLSLRRKSREMAEKKFDLTRYAMEYISLFEETRG
jgi:glycosyltransferase involved in cell wall biosynthesis